MSFLSHAIPRSSSLKCSDDSVLASEDDILACVARHFSTNHPALLVGRGDDCCVLRPQGPLCISTDLFMEDVHFRRSYFTPEDIGWKALAVNLSDLAACGARPVGFSLGLALPAKAKLALVDGLFRGMADAAQAWDLTLSGGDLSRAERLHLCLTVFGVSQAPGGALLRSGCRAGDFVFLIGRVGLARIGLEQLETQGRRALATFPEACSTHLRPVPLLHEGLILAELAAEAEVGQKEGPRLSLMDVSDGLARDLPRLLGKELGLDLTLPPVHCEVLRAAGTGPQAQERARHLAVSGGEDYALLGACSPDLVSRLTALFPEIAFLGQVLERPGIRCAGRNVSGGFDHFNPAPTSMPDR